MKRFNAMVAVSLVLSVSVLAQSKSLAQVNEKLTKQQLHTLIATAKTPAEHQRIADYYEGKAQELTAESKAHARMAEQFRQNPITASGKFTAGTVNHCEFIHLPLPPARRIEI
jgi:sensor histidine kinase regulating citrate/malate metabolism